MTELSDGVKILLERMKTNPEDFYGDSLHWRFMFAEKFRDVLTEPEKGMIHEALKNLRRVEFDGLVVATILRDDEERAAEEKRVAEELLKRSKARGNQQVHTSTSNTSLSSIFGSAPMKQSAQIASQSGQIASQYTQSASQYDTSLQNKNKYNP
jgi:hypothetical protein